MTDKVKNLDKKISQLTLTISILSVLFFILEAFITFLAMDRGGIYFFLPIIYLVFAILNIIAYIVCKKKDNADKSIIVFFIGMFIFRFFAFKTALSFVLAFLNLILIFLHTLKNNNVTLKIFETILTALTILLSIYVTYGFFFPFDDIDFGVLTLSYVIHALIYGLAFIINILLIFKIKIGEQPEFIEKTRQIEYMQQNEDTTIEDLKALKELLDCGAISQEEFDKKKSEILNL